MQVIASARLRADAPSRASIAAAFLVGAALVGGSILLLYLMFGTGLIGRLTPSGRPTTAELVAGALAWTIALTAPAGFGLYGLTKIAAAIEHGARRRAPRTPVLRAALALPADHTVASRVRLPDGSRIIPELVIGPFGAAVVEELPPADLVVSRGVRAWEVRTVDGRTRLIDDPLDRATRDAERVRAWFAGDDHDHVVKVYAAVVGTDPAVGRSPTCAVIRPDQLGAWFAALPPQRSFDDERRARVVEMVRAAV